MRAVEKALAETPPNRRRELLATLSERVQARRMALRARAEQEDVLGLFEDVDDPAGSPAAAGGVADEVEDEVDDEVDGDHAGPAARRPAAGTRAERVRDTKRRDVDHAAVEPPHPDGRLAGTLDRDGDVLDEKERRAARRVGALAWVLVVAAAMLVMCVAAALTFIFFVVRAALQH